LALLSLRDLIAEGAGLAGRRVFVRADLNVPLSQGVPSDDTRIRASLPTLQALREAGARVVLASHLGRPKGKVNAELSLRPVAARLSELLGGPVAFSEDTIGAKALAASEALAAGDVLLLENLRFYPGETDNDPEFARSLASLCDAYVNDAFGTAHRAHASTVGMVAFVDRVAAGLLLESELEHLSAVREPKRPLLCLLGGAKVSDKLAVLEALAPHSDVLAVGGAMAYTFLAAAGEHTGSSLIEADRLEDARRVVAAAEAAGRKLLLPTDHVVAEALEPGAETRIVKEIPDGWMGLDIGPASAASYAAEASKAATIFWNGPMGVFEMDAFAKGTETVAKAVADSAGHSVVGGGDSLAAVNKLGLGARIDHLSTGGGASLEYVQGIALPGVSALER